MGRDRHRGGSLGATATERLRNFKVKLQPMLGCIGVAPPANQSFRSGWLGSWGGNMDYNGVREGVTVYSRSIGRGRCILSATDMRSKAMAN